MLISFLVLWSIWLSSLIHFTKCPEYVTRGTAQVSIPLIKFQLDRFVWSSFLGSSEIIFINLFFHFHLFDSVSRQDSQEFVCFLFSERSNLVLTWSFHSASQMLFATFSLLAWYIFYAKFHSYVLTVYSNGVYESFQFFFIFCK